MSATKYAMRCIVYIHKMCNVLKDSKERKERLDCMTR